MFGSSACGGKTLLALLALVALFILGLVLVPITLYVLLFPFPGRGYC